LSSTAEIGQAHGTAVDGGHEDDSQIVQHALDAPQPIGAVAAVRTAAAAPVANVLVRVAEFDAPQHDRPRKPDPEQQE